MVVSPVFTLKVYLCVLAGVGRTGGQGGGGGFISVNVYENENFNQGTSGDLAQFQLRAGSCFNLNSYWNDEISSIDPGQFCVVVFQDYNCGGRPARLQRYSFGTWKLVDVKLNDAISSMRPC